MSTGRQMVLDALALGTATVVAFVVLLTLAEPLLNAGRAMQLVSGTFSAGHSADYASRVEPKVAPLRVAPAGVDDPASTPRSPSTRQWSPDTPQVAGP